MIDLIEHMAELYPQYSEAERLRQADFTKRRYNAMKKSLTQERIYESSIPEEDIKNTVALFIDHPDLGAGRAHVTLIDQEKAYISATTINEIKQECAQYAETEYVHRLEEQKQLEHHLDELKREKMDYHHIKAAYAHHIWAVDFVTISFLGMHFALCVIFEEYSQSYLAVEAANSADHQLAQKTLEKAMQSTLCEPELIRRDNGKPFQTMAYQDSLASSHDYPIPPGSPWFNGCLESCNTSLKSSIQTVGMQDMANCPQSYNLLRYDRELALHKLQDLVNQSVSNLNSRISRMKFRMPPHKVLMNELVSTNLRHQNFILRKQQQRKQKTNRIRDQQVSHKPLRDKIRSACRNLIGSLDTNKLFVFNEILHHRFKLFQT